MPIDDRKLPYYLSVVAAPVVFTALAALLMQEGAIDALNATRAP